MAIWIKTPPDAEPVWMAADNRIRELALSIERRASIAPDADRLILFILAFSMDRSRRMGDVLILSAFAGVLPMIFFTIGD